MLKLLLFKVLDIKLSVDCVVIFLVLFKFLKLFVLFVDNWKKNGIGRGCFL